MEKPILLKLSKSMYSKYVGFEKTEYYDLNLAQKKVTRSFVLGDIVQKGLFFEWRKYGDLLICINTISHNVLRLINLKGRKFVI